MVKAAALLSREGLSGRPPPRAAAARRRARPTGLGRMTGHGGVPPGGRWSTAA